ncbi:hypothetical protein L249_1845 [Ophiocordyceps polyrhachis-furcata BCC 54312]|uniref:DNA replication complex GINS protein PSF3 n=1 Tax=Ophiocordyceps polyrhachis-furcata BCC 54312 TaxID=1330021 RepID=A0A367LS03_9HYPO|nr:hypothetical protein L249_1845 [Ophiocordyceps polyrhachis-furcata BCC 54312]
MSYYDVDAILADAENLPCRFQLDVPLLAQLDSPSAVGLKPGTALSLPLWLCKFLAVASVGGNTWLKLDQPPCLSEETVAALKADPRAVSLRDQNVYFFGVGVRLMDLLNDAQLNAVLCSSFIARAIDVGLLATGEISAGQANDFLRGLDDWEMSMFRSLRQSVRAIKAWLENINMQMVGRA